MNSLFPLKLLNFFRGYLEGSKALPFAAGILWITAVGVGMWSLMAFDTTPGGSGLNLYNLAFRDKCSFSRGSGQSSHVRPSKLPLHSGQSG